MRSQRTPADSSRGSRSAPGPTACAYGRSRAATRSAIRTTCGESLCLLAAAAALAFLCGCGGHGQAQSTLARRGRTVFVAACASCHTLTGHDSRARGGDLAIAELSTRAIVSFANVMPVHLTRAET